MKILLLILLLFLSLFSKDIKPYRYITASHAVSDFIKVGNKVVIGTGMSPIN